MSETPLRAEAPLLPPSPLQRQIAQLALDLAAQLEAKAGQAPRGRILADCEALLLEDGRQFLRDSLTATLQPQAAEHEKKGGRREPVLADRHAAPRAPAHAPS
jgi:hypothetical protein